jgi:methionyl-tRNA formyltransferase
MDFDTGGRVLIIGEGTLPVQCANILLKHGFEVLGVCSPDDPLRKWAEARRVRHLTDLPDFAHLASSEEYEYLFSIVNYRILSASLLATPRRYAINYHDALLPEFAGTYATSWAIMAGQETHGITWHVMTEGVDEGDILKQVSVPVSETESAASLNLKCYYTALYAFDELAQELKAGSEVRVSQNLNRRTYFEFTKRPPAGCLIAFDSTASQIDAFTRSLDFGSYNNPLGLSKVLIGSHFYAVPRVVVSGSVSSAAPGTVTALADDSFHVATQTQDVVLASLKTLYGSDVSINDLIQRDELAVGSTLQKLDPRDLDRITGIHTRVCRYERYWVKRLSDLVLTTLPLEQAVGSTVGSWKSLEGKVSGDGLGILGDLHGACPGESLAIAHAIFLASVLQSDRFDIAFSYPRSQHELAGIEEIFAPCLPLRVDLRQTRDLPSAMAAVSRELRELKKRGPYMRDLALRHPESKFIDPLEGIDGALTGYPVAIRIVCRPSDDALFATQCNFHIQEDGGSYRWTYNQVQASDDSVAALMRQFDDFLFRLIP